MKNMLRVLSAMMALLLLLGMMPAATFAEEAGTCQHWRWYYEEHEPDCVNPGYREKICAGCGKVLAREKTGKKALGHAWSEWYIYTEQATCTQGMEETRECERCNAREYREITMPLGHDVKDWGYIKKPTCTESGSRAGICMRCKQKVTEKLGALGHYTEKWKILVEATDHSKGEREGVCMRCGKGIHEEYYPEGTLKKGDKGADVKALQEALNAAGFSCGTPDASFGANTEAAVKAYEKSIGLDPDGIAWPKVRNGLLGMPAGLQMEVTLLSKEFDLAPDDEVHFKWMVTNIGKQSIMGLTVQLTFGGKTIQLLSNGQKAFTSGESLSGEWSQTFTKKTYDAYVKTGWIELQLGAGGTSEKGSKVSSNVCDLEIVLRSGGKATDKPLWTPPAILKSGLKLEGTVTSEPDNGQHYIAGETVTIVYKLQNTGKDTYTDYGFTQNLYEESEVCRAQNGAGWGDPNSAKLLPNKDASITLKYVVTDHDAEAGGVLAKASAYAVNGAKATVYVNAADIPIKCGKPISAKDGIKMTLEVANGPEGEFFKENEQIEYMVTLRNDSTEDITDLTLDSSLLGGTFTTVPLFVAGDVQKFSISHTVTEEDAGAGEVIHVVTARWGKESIACNVKTLTGIAGQGLVLKKECISEPDNGSYFVKGEKVVFRITVENNGDKLLKNVFLFDPLYWDKEPVLVGKMTEFRPGKSASVTVPYIITEEDVANESYCNQAYAVWFNEDSLHNETVYSNVVEVLTSEKTPVLKLTKALIDPPLHETYFLEGETIRYSLTIENETDHDIGNIDLYDGLCTNADYLYKSGLKVKAHGTLVEEFDYELKKDEWFLPEYSFANFAWATGTDENGDPIALISNSVTVTVRKVEDDPTGKPKDPEPTSTPVIIEIEPTSTPVIEIKPTSTPVIIEIEPTSTPVIEIKPTSTPVIEIKPTSTPLIEVKPTATPEIPEATKMPVPTQKPDEPEKDPDDDPVIFVPDPAPDDDPIEVVVVKKDVTIEKSVISISKNEGFYIEGEDVVFQIAIVNDTDYTYHDIAVYDILSDMPDHGIGDIAQLEPGAVYMINYVRHVTESDVKAGKITNIAWITFQEPAAFVQGLIYERTIYSNKATVRTGKVKTVVKAEHCVPTLTGLSSNARRYEIRYCKTHTPLALRTAEAQSNQELLLLVDAWTDAINRQYDAWKGKLNVLDRSMLETERTAFFENVNAFYARSGDLRATVNMLQNKCMDTCYTLATADAARSDSLLNKVDELTVTSGETCGTTVVTTNSKNRAVQNVTVVLCGTHAAREDAGLQSVLSAKKDKEKALAWVRLGAIEQTAMDVCYNRMYIMADEETRALVLAERQTFAEWLNAERQVWQLLYPNAPAKVGELSTNALGERCRLLCAE